MPITLELQPYKIATKQKDRIGNINHKTVMTYIIIITMICKVATCTIIFAMNRGIHCWVSFVILHYIHTKSVKKDQSCIYDCFDVT